MRQVANAGNPFHHHQDLNRLVKAWQRPQTIIVHEPWRNALARHADIVLPATTSLERNDIGKEASDPIIFAMQQAIAPVGDARNDYEIFSALADRLGFREAFTEGRSEDSWLWHLYSELYGQAKKEGIDLPGFDTINRNWVTAHGGPPHRRYAIHPQTRDFLHKQVLNGTDDDPIKPS